MENGKRYKLIYIPLEMVFKMMFSYTFDEEPEIFQCTNLPKDCKILAVEQDFQRQALILKVESKEFEEIPAGYGIPEMELEIMEFDLESLKDNHFNAGMYACIEMIKERLEFRGEKTSLDKCEETKNPKITELEMVDVGMSFPDYLGSKVDKKEK